MQAQAQSVQPAASYARGRTAILGWITGIHVALHAMWYILPSFLDGDDIGPEQYIVTTATFVLGLVALAGMWRNQTWGRWMMIVVTVINIFLVLPEVFFLEGVLRAGSIAGMVGIVATMVLLFRPEIRKRS